MEYLVVVVIKVQAETSLKATEGLEEMLLTSQTPVDEESDEKPFVESWKFVEVTRA